MFIVIVPSNILKVGTPIYANWQWTEHSNGEKKLNTACQGTVDRATSSEKLLEIGFFYNEYYKFDGEMTEGGETLNLRMTNPAGDKSNSIVLRLTYPVIGNKPEKSIASTQTVTIKNDTPDTVWCDVHESGSSPLANNMTLAMLEEGVIILGSIASVPTATVTFIGAAFATVALIDGTLGFTDHHVGLLLAGDELTRTSRSWVLFGSDNDLTITTSVIHGGQTLNICRGRERALATKTLYVSDLSQSGGGNQSELILRFHLPRKTAQYVESCTLIRIPGFTPDGASEIVEELLHPTLVQVKSGTMFSTNSARADSRAYGVMTTHALKPDMSRVFWFVECVHRGIKSDHRKIVRLPSSNAVVLRLHKYGIEDPIDGLPLGYCSSELHAIKHVESIMNKGKYSVYSWYKGNNQALKAYIEATNMSSIKYNGDDRS